MAATLKLKKKKEKKKNLKALSKISKFQKNTLISRIRALFLKQTSWTEGNTPANEVTTLSEGAEIKYIPTAGRKMTALVIKSLLKTYGNKNIRKSKTITENKTP